MPHSYLPTTSITVELPEDPQLYLASHNKCLRFANEHCAVYHHEHHIERHFTDFAGAKYGYKARSKKYLKFKLRTVRHTIDNVYTGATKTSVLGSRTIRVTPKGATLIMPLPSKFGRSGRVLDAAAHNRLAAAGKRKPLTQKAVDARVKVLQRVSEIEALAPDEIRTLNKILHQEYHRRSQFSDIKRKVRIKVT